MQRLEEITNQFRSDPHNLFLKLLEEEQLIKQVQALHHMIHFIHLARTSLAKEVLLLTFCFLKVISNLHPLVVLLLKVGLILKEVSDKLFIVLE